MQVLVERGCGLDVPQGHGSGLRVGGVAERASTEANPHVAGTAALIHGKQYLNGKMVEHEPMSNCVILKPVFSMLK